MKDEYSPRQYGAYCATLLEPFPHFGLGPGKPRQDAHSRLSALDDRQIFGQQLRLDSNLAACCRAGLWLAFNYLDESHALSQDVETRDGSYWHALMHRREPDFGNAKYWFHRVGVHEIFDDLGRAAGQILQRNHTDASQLPEIAFLRDSSTWDPFRFVDLCELAYRQKVPCVALCEEIAHVEWQLLFDSCYRRATAA